MIPLTNNLDQNILLLLSYSLSNTLTRLTTLPIGDRLHHGKQVVASLFEELLLYFFHYQEELDLVLRLVARQLCFLNYSARS